MTPDHLNGTFELFGSLVIWFNVRVLYLHKEIRGISPVTMTFFLAWGVWNLYYYPYLEQWVSFAGGVSVVLANAVWVGQMIWYGRLK